ncbi:aminoglycoside phosphotransferase [Stanieria cyanosphaera PCC 7437]|uniref:Aminoglycoside phosphotransferase n=1 Tax=Stanieria cyanosphaera (strain ATCC 29371 / PCC 7437) TaxID=111780 RepID=K9XQW5_STAC7|nr:phosphotransferase [Stanieria cyanosphaera]AFZ34479.1 aminoglycoside phosphotransferase [Stanieria cyanosphaera PCC 7437]
MVLASNVFVSDPFNSANDPKMPFLAEALNPIKVQKYLTKALFNQFKNIQLHAIRVIRHKLGRRCAIAYELTVDTQSLVIIGKARAKGLDHHSYELQRSLWQAGFSEDSSDGISVPEPLGIIPEWQMWLQKKVPGTIATDLLPGTEGVAIASKIAEAAHKLHQTGIFTRRCHTMSDELNILHERLPQVAQQYPQWEKRLEQILSKCDRLGANTPELSQCGIHRDFYGDQVIVNGEHLYLIDLDLYCQGNPALDIGNFIAHITEYSLRILGNPNALADREAAMAERFIQFHGEAIRLGIQSYTTLTLVRHIYISTQISDRSSFTEAILELCEQRLR